MRLIDADALENHIKDVYCKDCNSYKGVRCRACWVDDASIAIDSAPTVDAVEVVRCKDCKHYRGGVCEQVEYIMDGYYHDTFEVKRPDDFCSYGEMMDGGSDND